MKYIISILAMMICVNGYAQLTPAPQTLNNSHCIDTARFEIRYSFKFKNHPSQKHFDEDMRVIQVGKNVVKDFSEIVYHYDSLATENFKKGLSTSTNPYLTFPCEIYNYPKEKQCHEKYRLFLSAGVLCYPSKWTDIEWNYSSNDTIKLLGYTCDKAIANFAGRKYTAWYTLDVPIPYGPYKFSGLPGLIIRIEESNGMYVWEFCSLSTTPSCIYNYQYEGEQKCTAEAAAKTIKRMITRPMTFLSSVGVKMMQRQSDGTYAPATKDKKENQYEPIELK